MTKSNPHRGIDPFDSSHPDYNADCGFVVCRAERCSIQEVHPIHPPRGPGGRPSLSAAARRRRDQQRIRELHRKMAQKHGDVACNCGYCVDPASSRCPRCGGKGWIDRVGVSCPDCLGRGSINGIRAALLAEKKP